MAGPAQVRTRGETGKRPSPLRGGDAPLLRLLGGAGALIPALALAFIVISLVLEAWPAVKCNGWSFFSSSAWNPGSGYGAVINTCAPHAQGADFGAGPLIVGTLASSAIALIIAVPVSIGAALIIVERLPRRISYVIGLFLEVLAGIPSVIIGLWGVLTFGPFISEHIAPAIARAMPDVPVLKYFGTPTGTGLGLLNSGLILAIMVIPIIAATTRDLIRQVPILPREGALALGMSDWECARRVTIPWVGSGIIGAVVLGLGRALGETIAVAMVSGSITGQYPSNIYSAMTTFAATIVNQLDGALGDASGYWLKTLAECALVLMAITLLANVGARLLVRKVSGTALPVGRGL
ncbi:MAG TPA: phosphate ABC transporter permease subunit PstC [Trebonia sp.]|jgi:phosphate transport system permease protein|nr:phosphate ABC transporter permease subunit PstC [Trebonia sp.]